MTRPEVVALVEAANKRADQDLSCWPKISDAALVCMDLPYGMIRAARRAVDESKPVGEFSIIDTAYGTGFSFDKRTWELPAGVYLLTPKPGDAT